VTWFPTSLCCSTICGRRMPPGADRVQPLVLTPPEDVEKLVPICSTLTLRPFPYSARPAVAWLPAAAALSAASRATSAPPYHATTTLARLQDNSVAETLYLLSSHRV